MCRFHQKNGTQGAFFMISKIGWRSLCRCRLPPAALVAAWGSDSGTDSEGECVRGDSGHWEPSASYALREWRRAVRAEQRAAAEHSRGVTTFGEPGGRL